MIEPRAEFLDDLEAQLRTRHRALQPHRTVPWRAAAVIMMVLFAASLLLPSVRSFAQGAVDDLFKRADSDTLPAGEPSIQYFVPIDSSTPEPQFQMRVPADIPNGFELDSITVSLDGKSISQQYIRPGRFLIISQRISESEEDDGLVGASAEIVPATINDIEGAYVEGVWGAENIGDDFTWMSDASFRQLRWIEDDIRYEIYSMGGSPDTPGYLSMEEMIELAESLEPSSLE